MLFHLSNFGLMLVGYSCIYQSVFLFFDWSTERKVFGIQFHSDFAYTLFYTFCSLFLVYPGVSLLNFAYLREARLAEGNLWFPYFMAALAMPLTFGILNTFQRGAPFDRATLAALIFLACAIVARYGRIF